MNGFRAKWQLSLLHIYHQEQKTTIPSFCYCGWRAITICKQLLIYCLVTFKVVAAVYCQINIRSAHDNNTTNNPLTMTNNIKKVLEDFPLNNKMQTKRFPDTESKTKRMWPKFIHLHLLSYLAAVLLLTLSFDLKNILHQHSATSSPDTQSKSWLHASAHVVLTRDDRGQNLVLTGEEGKKGGGGGDQLVISGNNMDGEGHSSNMILQDASNREGDVVMSGRSMIIPGEDGHIVLADSRRQDNGGGGGGGGGGSGFMPPPMNPFMSYWGPYMSNRMYPYRMMMPFFG